MTPRRLQQGVFVARLRPARRIGGRRLRLHTIQIKPHAAQHAQTVRAHATQRIDQHLTDIMMAQDFHDLTLAYFRKAAEQNVIYVEPFFDPQAHTERGVEFDTVVKGINRALKEGEKKFGISSKLIMSFLRHLPEKSDQSASERKFKDAFETLDEAREWIEAGMIHGIGLDSSENPFPPSDFKRVFAEAKNRHVQLMLMAHAGEEGPAEYVRQALDVLKVDRIDHGNHVLDDELLTARVKEAGIGLTVCPLSNIRLRHPMKFKKDGTADDASRMENLNQHTLRTMMNEGLKVSINSDDPAYFGGYMNENYLAIAEALNLTRDEVVQLARNAIETCFLAPEEKQQQFSQLALYVREHTIVSVAGPQKPSAMAI